MTPRLRPHYEFRGVASFSQASQFAAHQINGPISVTLVVHLEDLAQSLDVGNMSEYATQLSTILVDELFGHLPSRIFGALAFHGRLPFSRLLQHTRLSHTELKHGLSILIQQQLVLWYDPESTGQALYEADIQNSYALARSGKYGPQVQNRFGNLAAEIISNGLILGYVCVDDLIQTYFPSPGQLRSLQEVIAVNHHLYSDKAHLDKINGTAQDERRSVDSLCASINDLLQAGLLSHVHASQFRTVADNTTEAKQVVSWDESISSKKAQQATFDAAVAKKLREWRYGTEVPEEEVALPKKGAKRVFEGENDRSTSKKRRMTGHVSHDIVGDDGYPKSPEAASLNNEFLLRINHEKFAILNRNRLLVALVEESIGFTTARIYEEVLRQAESQLKECAVELDLLDSDDDQIDTSTLPKVSINEIGHLLHDLPNLADSLGDADPEKINLNRLDHPKKVKRRRASKQSNPDEAMVVGSASSDEGDDSSDGSKSDISGVDHDSNSSRGDGDYSKDCKRKTPDTTPDTTPKMKDPESPLHSLRLHFILLAEHPHQFLIPAGGSFTASDKWAIPYSLLSRTLLHNALLNITTSRFGPLAGRLFRILSSTDNSNAPPPKLDEKALVLLSLIPQKPMRTLLHSMHRAGHIELQELPKDGNQRRPGTTNFYWFFDAERMRRKVLEETYKTMANLIRRARVEREAVKAVVEKSERTDVVGREEELLGEEELKALKEWREREERIWGEVGRLDDLVAVLRDF